MLPDKIGFAGLGLIGGAIAKTIHRVYPDITLIAYDIDSSSLKLALKEQVIFAAFDTLSQEFADCSYIFLCAPIHKNEVLLEKLSSFAQKGCIITDVGSVKTSIHQEIEHTSLAPYFIGGHPMAGSEKSGYSNSTPYLLENAYYILTPTSEVSPDEVNKLQDFIRSLGAIPMVLDYCEHDYVTGVVSHLPHILASALVHLVQDLDNETETMKSIAAGGFKDITRIASSSPVMWQQICLSNKSQILALMTAFISSLEKIKETIATSKEDEILQFFQEGKEYRDSINITTIGSLPNIHEIYCDLVDETGGIATLATILATNQINIKNIGIIHNREFQDGVLHIEFYHRDALQQALILLRKYHYTVYER
ncbi:MAG: prephenate dehydrogenase [Lachnospiraceae bacterium]